MLELSRIRVECLGNPPRSEFGVGDHPAVGGEMAGDGPLASQGLKGSGEAALPIPAQAKLGQREEEAEEQEVSGRQGN